MFEVDPKQVQVLESKDLVLLLRRLLHAEAQRAGVALGAVSVPLQITVPDGGEDGRISWTGGVESTDYLPSRTIFFQCKASKIGLAGWKKESWDKSTHRKGKVRKLTPALLTLIAQEGSYVGFTTEALTGDKRDSYIAGIKEAIIEAGGDPGKLTKIDLYDANHIADWARQHPAVALWLSEMALGRSLSGFQTIQGWGTRSDFNGAYADDNAKRYAIGKVEIRSRQGDNRVTAEAAWDRILQYVSKPGQLVRVVGTSGLGKSRFVFERLKSGVSVLAGSVNASTVFADFRVVPTSLLAIASDLAESKNPVLLVVDECPRTVAIELAKQAARNGSLLSIITIDTDDRPLDGTSLHVSLSPGGADLVEGIIRKTNSSLKTETVNRLRELCGGFPRFAVLAAKSVDGEKSFFETTEDVIDRILVGADITDPEEVRALECLSLFESLSMEASAPIELDAVAEHFGRMAGDAMFEHLTKAQKYDIVGRNGDRIAAQPLPVAVNLATRRASVMRPNTLLNFIAAATDDLALGLLRRLRYLDRSPTVQEMGQRMLRDENHLGSREAILTTRGAALLDALVHLLPDRVASHLDYFVLPLSKAEVAAIGDPARRSLVKACARLVFRRQSFASAARLLIHLAVSEDDRSSESAAALFKQLFQIYLSGTEVPPEDRFAILDEGLRSDNAETVTLCVEALASAFSSDVIRVGDYGTIGSNAALKDWAPTTYGEIDDFYQEGLKRLLAVREARPEVAERSEEIIAKAARRILNSNIYAEYAEMLASIAAEKGGWPDAVDGVGDWLFFDRPDTTSEKSVYVRKLYDRLFPQSLIDRAIVFTKFWQSDIRDPDLRFADDDRDYEFSERASREVARQIAADSDLALQAATRMSGMDLKSVYPFADELGQRAENREDLFDLTLETLAATGASNQMLRGLLHGIDVVDAQMADRCVAKASARLDPSKQSLINIHSALETKDLPRLETAIGELEAGRIPAADFAYLSYGRGLDGLSPEHVAILLRALAASGSEGAWSALEIALMYHYGEPASPTHARGAAALLIDPVLLGSVRDQQRDSHIFESLLDRVQAATGIGEEFAEGLALQVTGVAKSRDYGLVHALTNGMRHAVELLVEHRPEIIWDHVARFFQSATAIERGRLKRFIGADDDRFDQSDRNGAGPLFGIPNELIWGWIGGGGDRSALPVEFFPVLTPAAGGERRWHPDLEGLADRYGGDEAFQKALAQRMRPMSWSDSIVPLLEVYLEPLKGWFKHKNTDLARWAKSMHSSLVQRIESETDIDD